MLFQQGGNTRIWREAHEEFELDCSNTALLACFGIVFAQGLGTLVTVHGSITGEAYASTLRKYAIPNPSSYISKRKVGYFKKTTQVPHRAKVAVAV